MEQTTEAKLKGSSILNGKNKTRVLVLIWLFQALPLPPYVRYLHSPHFPLSFSHTINNSTSLFFPSCYCVSELNKASLEIYKRN